MEQVGYDTYCKLLDEVMKEHQGIAISEEKDVLIDIGISCYIPDKYIDNSSQKIEVYQNISLCRTEEDIQNVIDETIDRYGSLPKELENLMDIARIKELCKKVNVIKVSQKLNLIQFYLDKEKFNPNIIEVLLGKYEDKIKFSSGDTAIITLKLNEIKNKELISNILEFLKVMEI